jgi:hypothetical protein
MNLDFLKQENWPKLGSGSHSQTTKDIHNWCSQLSSVFLELYERVRNLETEKASNDSIIQNLKTEINNAANSSKSICEWTQIVKQGRQNKKPTEQLVATNVAINELDERKRRAKNVIIYGVTESTNETIEMKQKDDESKINEIFISIDQENVKPKFFRRLRSKTSGKPGPILVELAEDNLRNKILASAKKLRSNEEQKSIYISPDLTEAQRLQDFNLRAERNKMNAQRKPDDPFWFGIRGNQIVKFKKKSV